MNTLFNNYSLKNINSLFNKYSLDNININTDKHGNTILMVCIIHKMYEIVWKLLFYGADPSIKNKHGISFLYYAIKYNQFSLVRHIINNYPQLINEFCTSIFTPLIVAIKEGHLSIIHYLINMKANINDARDRLKCTTLMIASIKGLHTVVSSLIRHGANIDDTNRFKDSTLICAIRANNLQCVKVLVKYGCNIEHSNKTFRQPTAFMISMKLRNIKIALYLISSGAKVDYLNHDWCAFFYSLFFPYTNGLLYLIHKLIALGAPIKIPFRDDYKVLELHESIIKLLLKNNYRNYIIYFLNGTIQYHQYISESYILKHLSFFKILLPYFIDNIDIMEKIILSLIKNNKDNIKFIEAFFDIFTVEINMFQSQFKTTEFTLIAIALQYNKNNVVMLLLERGSKIDEYSIEYAKCKNLKMYHILLWYNRYELLKFIDGCCNNSSSNSALYLSQEANYREICEYI
jgi:ankyrin repeat protein